MGIISRVLQNQEQRRAESERKLIRFESNIGRHIFGKIPKGHNREFFCLDSYTWVWHEDWIDENGKKVSISTRYNLRPHDVLKSINGQPYTPVDDKEKEHLFTAMDHYVTKVSAEYNKILQNQPA